MTIVGLLTITLLIWLPRGLDLDRVVTPDEPIWLARSANFAQALSDGHLDQTYQFAHPGVTVMWAGEIAYHLHAAKYLADGPDVVDQSGNRIAGQLLALDISPLRTLETAREVLILMISAVLVATGWYAIRLFGLGAGLVGIAILATDPYHVALSRLLHLDALLSSLLCLSAVAWLVYLLNGRQRRDLLIAGVAIGLAGLTRSMAIVLLPMILVSAIVECRGIGERGWKRFAPCIKPVVAVGLIALVTFVALWPAMWTNPKGTIDKMISVGFNLAETAHENPIFFNGAIYVGKDPGPLFYPLSFLWRTTPALLVGLVLAAIVLVATRLRFYRDSTRPNQTKAVLYLTLLVLSVFAALESSDKKLDRYILPMIPPLALIAGWGFCTFARFLSGLCRTRRGGRRFAWGVGLVASVLIVYNVVTIQRLHPYDLDYYDPMFGGAASAQSDMMIGWGEGMDQIADAIAALPQPITGRIIDSGWKSPLTYFMGTPQLSQFSFGDDDAFEGWLRTDYFIWYITPSQRGYIPPEMEAYFSGLTPVKTVRLAGITYAALYDIRNTPLPAYFANQMWMSKIAPGLTLVKATLNDAPVAPGQQVTALCYFTGPFPTNPQATMQLSLTAPDGSVITGKLQSIRGDASSSIWTFRRRITLPETAQTGTYWVTARFDDGTTAQDIVLGSVTVQNAALIPTAVPVDSTDDNG